MRSWRPIVKMPGTSLSASKRVVGPRQAGLLAPDHCRWAPSQGTASVDLAHGSSVTVTGSRRIRTGFPFQLSISPSLHAGMEPLSLHPFTLGWSLYLSILSRWDGASLSHLSVVLNL